MVREGIALSDESVELLVERTEGWPAGLYLAALWLRDHADPDQVCGRSSAAPGRSPTI
jgi:ATP/maltotriose-dependent transcriptional regulator MalT